jgi:hypothetical protein
MTYEDIPRLQTWKTDTVDLKSRTGLVAQTDMLLLQYHAAFSPMAKRNKLRQLEETLLMWKTTMQPLHYAAAALLTVVKKKLIGSGSVAHTYDRVLCIGYRVVTGAFEGNTDVVQYSGHVDDLKDMKIRADQMIKAIEWAYGAIEPVHNKDENILKIFMAPEFYFRGRYGAYPPDVVSEIMPYLRKEGRTGKHIYKDWLFVFGTAISAVIDAETWCFTCGTNEHLDFLPDPTDKTKTVAKCQKGSGHNVGEGVFGAMIDNVALIQKGSESHLVTKEYISGIDFRHYKVSLLGNTQAPLAPRIEYDVKAPFGSRDSRSRNKTSKFAHERMGGSVFNFDGITFGMEICLDHLAERLVKAPNLQVLLIPSAGMDIKFGRTIYGGIHFNVDGIPGNPHSVVWYAPNTWNNGDNLGLPGADGDIIVHGPFALPWPKGF